MTDAFIKPSSYETSIATIKELHQALKMQYLRYPSIVTRSVLQRSHKIGFVHYFIPLTQNTNLDIAKATNGDSYLQLLGKAALKLIFKSIEKNCT